MKPFRERNPVIIGFAGLAAIAVIVLAAFKADQLPLIGGGNTYYANVSEAAGLKPNDEVRVAGVRVGKVTAVDLTGSHVRVTFQVNDGVDFGQESTAAIKIKTLLGAMYLAVDPVGPGNLAAGSTIPLARTTSPYDVVQAFSGLAQRTQRINTHQLATALNTLSATFKNAPKPLQGTLTGLSQLSRNVAARDSQIKSLLINLQSVSGVLADRNQQLVKLFKDGDVLFRALTARRVAIHNLLVSTTQLSTQLSGLVRDTQADLHPALSHLANVVQVLQNNENNIDQSLRLMAPFYRVFANTLGTGPWFDTFVQNLPPVPALGGQ
ncbi:MAG: MCE family protein [Nocardioidaceae bacterium]